VARFHVTAKGSTFIDKVYRINARKGGRQKDKNSKGKGSPRTFSAFPILLPRVRYDFGKEVVDILGRLLLVIGSLDIVEILYFHIW
jgi:hypothetical protein